MSEFEERSGWFRREVLPLEPMLRASASHFCRGGASEIDDLVHETYVKLISFSGWRDIENLQAYSLKMLRNEALRVMRRQKVVSIDLIADIESLNCVDDRALVHRTVSARDELRLLAKLIGQLPPQCRRVFTLCKVYGLSHEEIASRLRLSVFTVDKHVSKGLRICAEGLALRPAAAANRLVPIKATLRDGSAWKTRRCGDADAGEDLDMSSDAEEVADRRPFRRRTAQANC